MGKEKRQIITAVDHKDYAKDLAKSAAVLAIANGGVYFSGITSDVIKGAFGLCLCLNAALVIEAVRHYNMSNRIDEIEKGNKETSATTDTDEKRKELTLGKGPVVTYSYK